MKGPAFSVVLVVFVTISVDYGVIVVDSHLCTRADLIMIMLFS